MEAVMKGIGIKIEIGIKVRTGAGTGTETGTGTGTRSVEITMEAVIKTVKETGMERVKEVNIETAK